MNKTDVIHYFGSVKNVAKALNMSVQSIYRWPDKVPRGRTFELEKITNGDLKAEVKVKKKVVRTVKVVTFED